MMAAGVRGALGFLTIVGGAAPLDRRATPWFGPVGALVGAVVGTTWWLATEAWNPVVGATLAVLADLALTGLLHVDGLADAADGLLAPMDRSRRLAAMHDVAVGAFGVAAVVGVLGVRAGALTALAPTVALCAALWAASRALAALVLARVGTAPPPGGLAERFGGGAVAAPVAALSVAAVVATLSAPIPGLGAAAVVAMVAATAAVVALAVRRVGGHTGDVLGAAIVISETVGVLVAGVRW